MISPYVEWMRDYTRRVYEMNRLELEALKDLKQGAASTTRNVSLVEQLPKTQRRPEYVDRIQRKAWSTLTRDAEREVKTRFRELTTMREHQEFIAGLCRDIPQLRISAQRFPRPSSDPEWPTERERLQQLAEQQGLEQHRIEVGLKYFDNFDPKQEAKTLEQAVLRSRDRLQQNAERRLASLMGSMLALAVAAFNRAVSNGNDDNEVGTIADIEQATGRIEQREREIWHRLREADIFRVQQEALALGGIATQQIFDETIPKLAAISQLRPKELEDRELGALARSRADLMRRQLRAQALGEKLGWVVGWGEAGSEWEQWVKAAQESST